MLLKYSDETGMTTSSYFGSFIDKTFMQDGATPHYALIVIESGFKNDFQQNGMVDVAHITGFHKVLTSPRVTFFVEMSKEFFKIENMKKKMFLETFHRCSL